MKTVLYNTTKQKLESNKMFAGGYKVNGKTPELPNDIIQLLVVDTPQPVLNQTETIGEPRWSWDVELTNLTYTKQWNIVNLSNEEIALQDWKHPERPKRIIVDRGITNPTHPMSGVASLFFTYFETHKHPMEHINDKIHVYLNSINHVSEFQAMEQAGVATLENIPSILNPQEND